jgi:GNAT superfamily N-acetyltransferase
MRRRAADEEARERGLPRLWLSTTPFLHESMALYRHLGFVPAPGPADLEGTPLVSFELPIALQTEF